MDRQLTDISSSTIFRVIAIALALVFLWFVRDIVVMLLFSIVIASAVDPVASWLQKRRIPRAIGVLVVYVGVVLVLGAIIYLLVPPLLGELRALSERFPNLLTQLFSQFQDSHLLGGQSVIFDRVEDYVGQALERIQTFTPQELKGGLASGLGSLVGVVFSVAGGVFSTLLVAVLSFYLAVREKGIENFLRSVTPREHEVYVIHLWQRTQQKMGRWLQGQLLLGLIVGTLAYGGLFFLNVPFALTLALIAGVLELIPMVGPMLAAVPAVILAFFQSPLTGLLTLVVYVVIQELEKYLLVPQVMKRTVGLSPVIVILALLVGAKLGGIAGMLLAVPLAAALNELFNDLTERRREAAV